MNRLRTTCPMSGRQSDYFGGGTDQCPACGRLVYIAQTGRVALHKTTFASNDQYLTASREAERAPRVAARRRASSVRSVWCA